MAKIYFDLIKASLKTLDDVPIRWKDQVQQMLDAK
ncbi:CD1375 family protein [Paenibacillus woosongensis]|nr:CD1375 family protein [Paenibacillus woosongensis]